MISKQLKRLPRRISKKLGKKPDGKLERALKAVADAYLTNVYYPVESFFRHTIECVSRSLAFARHGYMSSDFDSAYLYSVMSFKLKRLQGCLLTGHVVQYKEDIDALEEAITICDRLFSGEYDRKYYKTHTKKWGELKTRDIPEYDDEGKIKYYRWESSRKNANTPSKKKKEVADLRQIQVNEEKDRGADLDRLHEILKNHEKTWWD